MNGNAWTILYPIDEIKTDSTLTKKRLGLNRLYASDLRVYLDSGEVRSITYFDKPDGIFYPMNQIKEEEKFIVGFEWLVAKRPKTHIKWLKWIRYQGHLAYPIEQHAEHLQFPQTFV